MTPNLGYRNEDLPARSHSGELVKKQQLALDLHYLLTAYGKGEDEMLAQQALASVTRKLYENPVLTREKIEQVIGDTDVKKLLSGIDDSDLADQVELVKITMENLSLEDLTKIWSSFFKSNSYRISVAYKATVVLLDSEQEAKAAMPVRQRNIYAISPAQPEITYVDPQMVEYLSSGMKITLVGKNLTADDIRIDFGEGLEVEDMAKPDQDSVTDEEMTIEIPGSVTAGIKQVKVLHPLSIGTPEKMHRGLESNTALFAVVPKIKKIDPSSLAQGQKLTVEFEPDITKDQEVRVIIGGNSPLKVEWSGAGNITDNVKVEIPNDMGKGTFPVRLRVDGAESQPDDKFANDYKRPVVTIL